MKVLFVTRPHIGLNKYGLRHQIVQTAECLRKRGIGVVYYDPWVNQIEEVDICHFFSSNNQMCHHVEAAKNSGKPIVMSPVFGYCEAPLWKIMLKSRLAHWVPGFCYHFVLLKKMLAAADRILVLNEQESIRLQKVMAVSEESMKIVPNGIDRKFAAGEARLFEERYGVSNFVLYAGTIDQNKNQLTVIRAMAGLPYTFVVIGEALAGHTEYMERCKAEAGSNVLFIGRLDYNDPMLASTYTAAKVFVLPSYSEVMPLVLCEAAQAGCGIVASKNVPVPEVISKYVARADPGKPGAFRRCIEEAMNTDADKGLRQAALSMPTWQDVAEQIMQIYEELLAVS